MKLKVVRNGKILAEAQGSARVHLVYEPEYKKGDGIILETEHTGFYRIRLEDTLEPAIVYINKKRSEYPIPFGVMRAGYSPRAFIGKRHFIEAEEAGSEAFEVRDITFNPFDQGGEETCANGIYPHAWTNVRYADSFRNKIFPDRGLFAPRNVIDGISASESHRLYPHQSFGINRNPDAKLTLEFGTAAEIQAVALTLRSEIPHDSWWEKGVIAWNYADGHTEKEEITFAGTAEEQMFAEARGDVVSMTLQDLKNGGDGFPALSLIRVIGKYKEV